MAQEIDGTGRTTEKENPIRSENLQNDLTKVHKAFVDATGANSSTIQPKDGLPSAMLMTLSGTIFLIILVLCTRSVWSKINTNQEMDGGAVMMAISLSVIALGVFFVYVYLVVAKV